MWLEHLASARVVCRVPTGMGLVGRRKGSCRLYPGKVPLPFSLPAWPMRCAKSEPLTCKLGEGWGARERGPLYTEF